MAVTDTNSIQTPAQKNLATIQTATARKNSTTATLDTPQEIQDRFLKLLITQMQNQDPLSPMDNAQVTQQLAQISTVQGLSKLNDTMSQVLATQSSSAAQLIGRGVALQGSNLQLSGGQAGGLMSLGGNANEVKIEIQGPGGVTVRTLNLGAQPSGLLDFTWDGKSDGGSQLPDGKFTYKATAKAGTQTIAVESFTTAQVASVSLAATGPTLLLDNGQEVPVSSVKRIF